MKNNISMSGEIRPCTSCQVCGAVCPVEAIVIKLNHDGFYRPEVDEKKCIECGLCVKSCYKYDDEIKLTSSHSGKVLYAAKAKSEELVLESTSGGIAGIMAEALVREGYKCIGVVFDYENNCAVNKIATSIDEAEGFKGSKYIQTLSIEAFKKLVRENRSQQYAVFGLPCHIYALNRFLNLQGSRDKHILIDLYCHGCPSLNVWKKYTDYILNKYNGSRILSVNFRSKVRGWGNFNLEITIEGREKHIKVISPRVNDYFYTLFFSDLVLNDSCGSCEVRSTLEYTDIRIGDFWGPAYVTNHKGVSGITICSPQGQNLFEHIQEKIIYKAEDLRDFLPYQSYDKKYNIDPSKRRVILDVLSEKDSTISQAIEAYRCTLSIKRKAFIGLKNAIKLLPNNIISYSKYLFYRLKKIKSRV